MATDKETTMTHDRDYYRALFTLELLRIAREDGLNPELAIAITERLARDTCAAHTVGAYHVPPTQTGDQ